jgi:2-keto-3-deoxy-L-rhamnonate aldolase RhmA
MTTVVNHVLRQLRDGKLAIGLGLRQARTVDIAQIAKASGFDWLFIDCEHNSMSVDTAAQIAAASLAVGITPIVRVPGYEHHHASRALDNGAHGIVFPHVDSPEDARRLADYCRYPPVGHRSMGGGLQQLGFASMPWARPRARERETLVVVMLESPQASTTAAAIAAVPGSTRCSSARMTCASRWASPASSTTAGHGRHASSPPAASTGNFPAWAGCTRRSSSSGTSAWACAWCWRGRISRC